MTKLPEHIYERIVATLPSIEMVRFYQPASLDWGSAIFTSIRSGDPVAWDYVKDTILDDKYFWVKHWAECGGFDSSKLRTNPLQLEFKVDWDPNSDKAVNSYFLYTTARLIPFERMREIDTSGEILQIANIKVGSFVLMIILHCSKKLWIA